MAIWDRLSALAGFPFCVGNWITPTGDLIFGDDPETDHCQTLLKYLGTSVNLDEVTDNQIRWTNNKVSEGFIRLVFRDDMLVQVGAKAKEELWSEKRNYKRLRDILSKIEDAEVHLFSKTFYIVGSAKNIIEQKLNRLQIKEKNETI